MANDISYRSIFGNIDVISYLFSLLVFFGGLFAFIKTGSWTSIISALAFSSLLAIGAYKTSLNRKDFHFSLSVCLCLCLIMGIRYINTNKFMPAGLISSLSISMIIYLLMRIKITEYFSEKKKTKANKET